MEWFDTRRYITKETLDRSWDHLKDALRRSQDLNIHEHDHAWIKNILIESALHEALVIR